MDYDPIKDRLVGIAAEGARYRLFLATLHLVFLRSWHVRRVLSRLLASSASPDIHVLDAGTGFGQYADWLLRRDVRVRVAAVDVKRDYLDRLEGYFRRAGLSDRVVVTWEDLTHPRLEGPYDLVLSVDVMEHIQDDVGVLAHFARALRPGGALVLNTPSDRGGSGVRVEGGRSFIGEHVRSGYGAEEIRSKLEEAGLRAESIRYTYGPAGSAAWRLLVGIPIRALGRSMLLAPLVAIWYAVALPVGLALNALDVALPPRSGTGLLVVARKPQP